MFHFVYSLLIFVMTGFAGLDTDGDHQAARLSADVRLPGRRRRDRRDRRPWRQSVGLRAGGVAVVDDVVRDEPAARLAARSEAGQQQEGASDPRRADQLPGGRLRRTVRVVVVGGEARGCRWTPRQPPQPPRTQHRHQQSVHCSPFSCVI